MLVVFEPHKEGLEHALEVHLHHQKAHSLNGHDYVSGDRGFLHVLVHLLLDIPDAVEPAAEEVYC